MCLDQGVTVMRILDAHKAPRSIIRSKGGGSQPSWRLHTMVNLYRGMMQVLSDVPEEWKAKMVCSIGKVASPFRYSTRAVNIPAEQEYEEEPMAKISAL